MDDPYRILGVSPNASDDEIKKAYRNLAKKYHPDLNPGDKTAEKRMNEINAAYDQIKNKDRYQQSGFGYQGSQGSYGSYSQAQQGGRQYYYYNPFSQFSGFGDYSGYGGSGSYSNTGRGYSSYSESPRLGAVRNYLNARRYQEALNALDSIPERNGRWYYYSAIANEGTGNSITALDHIKRACALEPNNIEYRALLQRLQQGGDTYMQQGRDFGMPTMNMSGICLSLFLMRLICRCCFGGF